MKDRIIGSIFITLSLLVLSACTAIETPMDDGYQFGDVTKTTYGGAKRLVKLRYQYCAAEDLASKEIALSLIHQLQPGYPEDGICTNLLSTLVDRYDIDVSEPAVPEKKPQSAPEQTLSQ